MTGKVETVRLQDKLFILDGKNPMMYVDLAKRKLVKYPTSVPYKIYFYLKRMMK